jgi:hypothetical protein
MPDYYDPPSVIFKKPIDSNGSLERELAYLGLHGIDWAQTRTIAKDPVKYGELNPVLGLHPTLGKVNSYFALTGLAHALLASQLSPEAAKWFQYGTIGLEAGMAGRNKFKLGIGMSF